MVPPVVRALLGAMSIGVIALGSGWGVRAQQPDSYQFLMTPERLQRLVQAWNNGLSYVPGEVIVKFRDGVGAPVQRSVLSLMRAPATERQETWIGEALLVRSTAADLQSDAVARLLALQPEVEWAQPNYLRRISTTPNDPGYSRQWNFEAIKMPQAWDINLGSRSTISVAVVDTGVTSTTATLGFPLWTGNRIETVPVPVAISPDLSSNRIAGGRDLVFWNGPVIDFVGHGTHVASTILEDTNNGLGLAGIAYQARLLPFKACVGYWDLQILMSAFGVPGYLNPNETGFCITDAVAQAVRLAADNGAQVINLSLGGPAASPLEGDAVRYAVSRGSFVSIAVGNEFEEGNPVEYPAAYAASIDGAIAVAAVGRSNRRAFYSNTGAHVEIAAPGGDSRDGGTTGMVFQFGLFEPDSNPATIIRPRFDRYADSPKMGTSMATPHVAGVAALLYSQGITRPAAIEAALKRFAVDLGAPGRDNDFGYGLIDARATLRGLGVAQ